MGMSGVTNARSAAAPASPARVSRDDYTLAKQHFRLGRRYYKRERFQEAAVEFQKSFDLIGKPELLYNIALCHYYSNNHAEALKYFKRYRVEQTGMDKRESREVDFYVYVLGRRLRGEANEGKISKSQIKTPAGIGEEEEEQPEEKPHRLAWGLLGTGAGLAIVGVASYFVGRGERNQYEDRVDALIRQGYVVGMPGSLRFADTASQTLYQNELESLNRKKEIFQGIAIGTLIGGALAAGVGGYLLWSGTRGTQLKLEPNFGKENVLQLHFQF